MNAIGSESVPVFVNIRGVAQICTDIHTDASAYVVTFKDWDGTVLKTEAVVAGGNATPPTHPTRTGYDSNGWSGSYTNVTSDRTITAAYKIKTFTVTFNYYSGSSAKTVTRTVNYGGSATPPTDTARDGYTFNGWTGDSYTNVTSNRTVTGSYTAISPDPEPSTYTVTFVYGNGDSNYVKTGVSSGTTIGSIKPSDPTRSGYTFNGWDKADGYTVTGNVTVTAQWTETETPVTYHTVRFYNNHSKSKLYETKQVAHGDTVTYTAPSLQGLPFQSWDAYKPSGGPSTIAYGSAITEDVDYCCHRCKTYFIYPGTNIPAQGGSTSDEIVWISSGNGAGDLSGATIETNNSSLNWYHDSTTVNHTLNISIVVKDGSTTIGKVLNETITSDGDKSTHSRTTTSASSITLGTITGPFVMKMEATIGSGCSVKWEFAQWQNSEKFYIHIY